MIDAEMTTDEFVARCAALAPALGTRAAEAEELRRLPDATMRDAADADLLRAVVPTSLGGHGLGLEALVQGTRELAHGCPASAWTLSFLMMHAWLLAKFPAAGVAELFAAGPAPLAPAPLAPTGVATVVDGRDDGLEIDGRWDWATGVAHADWVMVHAVQTVPEFETWFAVVPRDEVEVDDVWHTAGMRATGSNTVRIDRRFVPSHRLLRSRALLDSTDAVPGDGMAGLAVPAVLALCAATPALGAAEAAVQHYADRLATRLLAYTLGDRAAEQPAAQVRLATVTSAVGAARDHWEAAVGRLVAGAASGTVDASLRVASRVAAAATVRSARSIIADVCDGAGASVYFESHPLQRLQRDVETLKGHVMFDWDRTAELAGRHALGFDLRPTDLV